MRTKEIVTWINGDGRRGTVVKKTWRPGDGGGGEDGANILVPGYI